MKIKKIDIVKVEVSMNAMFASLLLTNVIIGGENIGFGLKPAGLLISGTYDVKVGAESFNPKKNDINKGDLIIEADNIKISSLDDLNRVILRDEDNVLNLKIVRDDLILSRDLPLISTGEKIKTGLYVKDELLGVGTVTFYKEETGTYFALGHQARGGEDTCYQNGTLYESSVQGISPSSPGKTGQKNATLNQDEIIGNIKKNTDYGIFGSYYDIDTSGLKYEIAEVDEIALGKAQFITVLDGDKKETFDIEITSINKNQKEKTKTLSLKVIDDKLINKTGGIVAGMSGSPIIQNGKIIGAVTHVITKDPLRGYGIFAKTMLDELDDC